MNYTIFRWVLDSEDYGRGFRKFIFFFFVTVFLFDAYFLWCWADARSVIKEIARKLPAGCPCPIDCSKRGWKSKIGNYAIWILTVFFYVYLYKLLFFLISAGFIDTEM